jgi:cellulose synthase/poly-beta-1,6-N-acetylglucosamine synthase-like glycosyltransferase
MTIDCVERTSQPELPQISVVIPIYNGESDLPDLLDCLRSQTYPVDRVEYLLVDNSSSDRTRQILQSLQSANAAKSQTFTCLSETQIQSSYAARNTGIRASSSRILAFTDADCRPQPNWLNNLIQPFEQPEVGIVAGEIMALPGTTLLERYANRHETLSQKYTLAHPFCPYGQTANLAIRRSALEQVGLFRPYLTTGGDADLCWRIHQQTSWKIQFAETAVVRHRHRSTLADLRSQWRRYGRSNYYLHQLHGVSLMRDPSPQDLLYRWSRWLFKEVPLSLTKINTTAANFSSLVDVVIDTPLDLLCIQARADGQRQATLAETDREIAWLNQANEELLVDVSNL